MDTNRDLPIEIETRSLTEVAEALLEGGFYRIMFDNFSLDDLKKAVEMVGNSYQTEASGGITIHNVAEYAAHGVSCISIGALTHSVKSLDLSLKAN
jgi:nicotinate-nucleotide pyrophosphorylase (carboxylating)